MCHFKLFLIKFFMPNTLQDTEHTLSSREAHEKKKGQVNCKGAGLSWGYIGTGCFARAFSFVQVGTR